MFSKIFLTSIYIYIYILDGLGKKFIYGSILFEFGHESQITQKARKIKVQVSTVNDLSVLLSAHNARAKSCCQELDLIKR